MQDTRSPPLNNRVVKDALRGGAIGKVAIEHDAVDEDTGLKFAASIDFAVLDDAACELVRA